MHAVLPRLILMLTSIFVLFTPFRSYAQERNCEEVLVEANETYSRGAFDETIELLDRCIANDNLTETQRKIAFRLKGLSFIGKGLEVDAKESIRRLIQLVPNYEPDPAMDPPNFVQLITEVKQEIDAELNAAAPTLEVVTPGDESAAAEPPPLTPATVTSNSTKRKKKGSTKWILGGLGVAAAGGLVAVLVSGGGGGSGDNGAIAEPPALP